jgi:outer membrane protein, adhesin transport system
LGNISIRRHALAVSLVLALGAPGLVREAAAERLLDAVRDALRAHPDVQSAAANLRAARQGYEQASAGLLPTLDLRLGAGREESDNAATRAAGQSSRTLSSQEAGVILRQNVYDAQQVRSEMARQNYRVDSARARLDETSESVAFRVVESYLESLRDGEIVTLSRQNVARHQATLDKTRFRFQSGVGQRVDVEQAEARLALAQSNLVSAQGDEQDSAARYRRTVGRLPVALEMPDAPAAALPPGLDAAQQEAFDNNYGLRAARSDMGGAKAAVRTVRADLYPRLDVEVAANRNQNIDGVPGSNNDNTAMLVMRYNLFRGGADQARVKEAVERENVAVENVYNTQRSTEETVARSWFALLTARARLAHLENHVRAIEQVLDAYQSQFELGRRSLLDLLNSEVELFQARSSLASGRATLRLSEYRLLAAISSLVKALGLADEIARLDTGAPFGTRGDSDAR